ncbi:MAG: S-layer protein, partial [Candidatus Aenigmarchaeota archaeon]|nr:S-layer protein [Candidatus Aenigmarchaeota archaeon]
AFIAKDSNDDGFTLVSNSVTEESDYVYVEADGTIAFKNSDNKIQESDASTFNITFEDTVMTVEINTTADTITMTDTVLSQAIVLNVDSGWEWLGTNEGDGEGSDVVVASINYGAEDKDARTTFGVIVEDPESNADSDKVILAVPSEQVKATVTISGPGSSLSTTTATEGGYTPAALPATGIAKVDSEAEAAKSGNLILVGGPAVNSLVAELAAAEKTRTAEGWRAETDGVRDFADTALIQAVDDAFTSGKTALVVAGYSSEDTANAAYVLQNYAKFAEQFADKSEVTVTGTTTDAVQ